MNNSWLRLYFSTNSVTLGALQKSIFNIWTINIRISSIKSYKKVNKLTKQGVIKAAFLTLGFALQFAFEHLDCI